MWVFLTLLTYALGLALIVFVIMQRKPPASTLAWILAIIFFPFVGALLYLWFGYGRIAYRVERRKRSNKKIAEELRRVEQALTKFEIMPGEQLTMPVHKELMAIADASNAFAITHGNAITFSTDPEKCFRTLVSAIDSAQTSVDLQYYIFRSDETGRLIRDALIRAAKRGVAVRLLVDGIGSWLLPSMFLKPLKEAGGKWVRYLPITPFGRPWHWNLRNHRKSAIIDGRIGFTGSANIGDEYRIRKGVLTDFDDVLVECRGPVVQQLQEVFAGDWFFATGENLFGEELFPPPERQGNVAAQVIDSGPVGSTYTLYDMLCAAIHAATKSVKIITPYFIPDQALTVSLRTAAMRGVDVEIMVAHHMVTYYEWFVQLASRSFYEELLISGIKIYEYQPTFLHIKGMSVDGSYVSIGTANMDMRSLFLNFEVNMNIYSSDVTKEFERMFEERKRNSRTIELSTFGARPLRHKFLENIMRVFSAIS